MAQPTLLPSSTRWLGERKNHTHTRRAYISNVHCHVKMHSKYTHSTQHKHICTQNKYLHAHSYIMSLIHKICKFPCVSYACATYLAPPREASSFCMHVMNTNIKSERLQILLFVFQFSAFLDLKKLHCGVFL